MLEMVITTLLTLTAYIFSQIVSIDNSALDMLVNSIPVIIPTFYMWVRTPRNYLKVMCIRSINIKYKIDIRIDECQITDDHFKEIRKNLLSLDQSDQGRILKESFEEILCTSSLEVDTGVIDLAYEIDEKSLIISSRNKIKYKLFFKISEDLLKQVQLVFINNEGISCNSNKIIARIKIEFIDKEKTDSKNPFWERLFYGFNNKIVSFKYKTRNDNSVLISTDTIEFIGNDIRKIGEDINKELTFLKIRN
ncbi:hypothetical protein [Tissierella praeacuta]|uniref:hypothetical protein n=1 Tax=Tissierella praeacuta TaxID=43131 RepID=UPI003341A865